MFSLKRTLGFLVPAFSLLFVISCEVGQEPIGPSATETEEGTPSDLTVPIESISLGQVGGMRISIDPSNMEASDTASAVVRVVVYDTLTNTPVRNKIVYFKATRGLVTALAVTDSMGNALAIYQGVAENAEVRVAAWTYRGGNLVAVAAPVTLSGVTLSIEAEKADALVNATVGVVVALKDAQGKPINGAPVSLTIGTQQTSDTTRGDGTITASVKSTSQTAVKISATARGATDRDSVRFWTVLPADTVKSVRSIRIFSSRSQMRADNTDSALITVILTGENNNPATGDQVRFSCNLGVIDEFGIVDAAGRATAILHSTPVNGTCKVSAVAVGRNDTASTHVIFTGVTVRLYPEVTEKKVGEYVKVEAFLKDGSGNPIGGDEITFTSTTGKFGNDSSTLVTKLDPSGYAPVMVTASSAGRVSVRASTQNASDSTAITFSLNSISLAASPTSIAAGGTATSTITASYVNGSNAPIAGAWIVFATNAGILSDDSVKTDADGKVTVQLTAASFAALATIQANAPSGSDTIQVGFYSALPAAISLAVTPDNIRTNGGAAELIATVTDQNGNMVTGASVNFRILKGPGGGEYIDRPMVTAQDGAARSKIFAGSVPSMYRAVEVLASVGSISDTSKLTISGPPHIITVSRPQDDTVVVPNAGAMNPSVFEFNVGAVVQDVNGNPVADGTPVHFSGFVSGMNVATLRFVRWEVSATDVKPVLEYTYLDVPFEDINNNLTMDPNVDLTVDYNNSVATRGDDVNGDGVMDYSTATHDFFWWFTGSEPYYANLWTYVTIYDPTDPRYRRPNISVRDIVNTIITPHVSVGGDSVRYDTTYVLVHDTTLIYPPVDSVPTFYADLNKNGRWDRTTASIDRNGNGLYDGPASGDFAWWRWEMRPTFHNERFDFSTNDFAVTVPAELSTTKNGVAEARLTYPRQFAHRLKVTINAETNGIRDRDGERFTLPVIK